MNNIPIRQPLSNGPIWHSNLQHGACQRSWRHQHQILLFLWGQIPKNKPKPETLNMITTPHNHR